MRTTSLSRWLAVAALCAFSQACFAQNPVMGGRIGQPGLGGGQGQATADKNGRPLTGQLANGLELFDDQISPLLQKYDIPGCVVAVMDNDAPVMVRGYGWADRDRKIPMSPDAMFRIGGLSKPITSAAILLLMQDGKLKPDTPVFDILTDYKPLGNATPDPRLNKITIRELLQHSGGWDASASFDPFDKLAVIANAVNQPAPPDTDSIIRYMISQPLQFEPGTKSVYSNFGYLLLGKVVEKVSGIPYEDYATSKIFDVIGASTFRLAATRKQERDPNEVNYYDYKGASPTTSLFDTSIVPRPDGSIGIESRGASDGWLASASDYLRFIGAIDAVEAQPDILSYDTLSELARRPKFAYSAKDQYYWGLGWMVRPSRPFSPQFPNTSTAHKAEVNGTWWHEGALPGTSSFAGRDANGRAWVVLFNSHPKDDAAWSGDMLTAIVTAMEDSQWGNAGGGGDPNTPDQGPDGPGMDDQ